MPKQQSGFLMKQRAFLKLYMITYTEQGRMYGLKILDTLKEDQKAFGYKPNHSEVYKALHDLIDEGILKQVKVKKEGMKLQEVVHYQFADIEKSKLYKKQLKVELDRCVGMLQKTISDNFGQAERRSEANDNDK